MVDNFLSNSTGKKLINVFEDKLILANFENIFNQFGKLLETMDLNNIKIVYDFVQRVERIDFLKKTWRYCIKEKGIQIINIEEKGKIAN